MGNLRQSMTEKEWDELDSQMRLDKQNGKPDSNLIGLSVWNKTAEELTKMREALAPFYEDWQLSDLDKWIKWKTNFEGK